MPQYNPPLRDMQFVLHEVLNVVEELNALPRHADIDADTINAVLEEGGKFASEVIFPLNLSGDAEGCTLDKTTHEVRAPGPAGEANDRPARIRLPRRCTESRERRNENQLARIRNSARQRFTSRPRKKGLRIAAEDLWSRIR